MVAGQDDGRIIGLYSYVLGNYISVEISTHIGFMLYTQNNNK
jgi:hypothetical protein